MEHVVAIGGSAGAVEALRTIIGQLPAGFPAAVVVVIHTSPHSPGMLGEILSRVSALPVHHARDHERIQPGHVYVALPDRHLIVEPGIVRLTKGPRENRFRPAIDPLFRSAAQVYGPRAIGVIITGMLDDGTAGLWAIKQLGGTAVVQDPYEADFPSMPESAVRHVKVDHVVPLHAIAPLLVHLTKVPVKEREVTRRATQEPRERTFDVEVAIAKEHNAADAGVERIGTPSPYACPECHGVLLELKEGTHLRFRCHTGHAYAAGSLLAAAREATDDALWNAVRALEECALLTTRLAEHVLTHGDKERTAEMMRLAQEAHWRSERVREVAVRSLPAVDVEAPVAPTTPRREDREGPEDDDGG